MFCIGKFELFCKGSSEDTLCEIKLFWIVGDVWSASPTRIGDTCYALRVFMRLIICLAVNTRLRNAQLAS